MCALCFVNKNLCVCACIHTCKSLGVNVSKVSILNDMRPSLFDLALGLMQGHPSFNIIGEVKLIYLTNYNQL